jgi:hypothetical protein
VLQTANARRIIFTINIIPTPRGERTLQDLGDSVPKPLGFIAYAPECCQKGGLRRPAIPAPESALWSHPCGAVSSAQVRLV